MTKLVLLDRDGVINISPGDGAYVLSPKDFHLEEAAGQAIALLNSRNLKVAVVTNQSCIGRGYIDAAILNSIHKKMAEDLKQHNAHVDALYFCPDHPEQATDRRKPNTGMLKEALANFNAKPEETLLIGDSESDIAAANKIGCNAHLVLTGHGHKQQKSIQEKYTNTVVHKNLMEAVRWLIEHDVI